MTWMSAATSNWNGYTVFSVIAGISLVILALFPDQKPSGRVINVVVGAGLVVYGVWAAQQTTGIYVFPVAIFIIPFAVGIKAISGLVGASNQRSRARQGYTPPERQGAIGPNAVVEPAPRVHPSPSAAAHRQPPSTPQPTNPVMVTRHSDPLAAPAAPPAVQLARPPLSPPLVVTLPAVERPAPSGAPRIVISYDDLDEPLS
jgi:hypothetical protein